jgi:hypothetical protein
LGARCADERLALAGLDDFGVDVLAAVARLAVAARLVDPGFLGCGIRQA